MTMNCSPTSVSPARLLGNRETCGEPTGQHVQVITFGSRQVGLVSASRLPARPKKSERRRQPKAVPAGACQLAVTVFSQGFSPASPLHRRDFRSWPNCPARPRRAAFCSDLPLARAAIMALRPGSKSDDPRIAGGYRSAESAAFAPLVLCSTSKSGGSALARWTRAWSAAG